MRGDMQPLDAFRTLAVRGSSPLIGSRDTTEQTIWQVMWPWSSREATPAGTRLIVRALVGDDIVAGVGRAWMLLFARVRVAVE